MPVTEEKKIYKKFIISTALVIALIVSGTVFNMAIRMRHLINEENLIRARVIFNTILLTRQWSANYGGVYVIKKEGVESNPYLKNPDIQTTDGRVLTLRNPSFMTREISAYAEKEGMFKFHITSLNLVNPHNMPDAFEEQALHRFETGEAKEAFRTERIDKRTYFRYMAPLMFDGTCFQCHQGRKYSIGDVRGGISISFDIEDVQKRIRIEIIAIVVFGIIAIAVMAALIYYFMSQLIRRLAEARRTIEKIAITDELTGLYNRRYFLSRFNAEFHEARRQNKNLGCIMADIDHFKAINDSQGHLFGDEVLKEVSRRIGKSIRVYDILGRYGGEEFLILLPDTTLEQAWHFAERTRMEVRETDIRGTRVTISLGVTSILESDQSIDDVIKRADEVLYKAKNAGRDRVEWM
ncbi:MAG TPA: diguanylate cyclase [Nitrospirota bacterium]